MIIGIIFIIIAVVSLLINNSEWRKDYIEKHNFQESEEILGDIRKIAAYIIIVFGVLSIFYDILLKIKV